jgi:hypothetical protein
MDLSSSIEKGVSFEFGKVPTEPSADAMLYVFLSVMARPSVPREHRKSLRIIGGPNRMETVHNLLVSLKKVP